MKGIAKLGSCAGQSILHIRDTPLSQHINCTLYILHVYAAWRKKMAYICVKRNTTSCSIGYVQKIFLFNKSNIFRSRFQWPRGLRRRSGAARLLRLWVRIPPEAWMFVCSECCVLSAEATLAGPEYQYRRRLRYKRHPSTTLRNLTLKNDFKRSMYQHFQFTGQYSLTNS